MSARDESVQQLAFYAPLVMEEVIKEYNPKALLPRGVSANHSETEPNFWRLKCAQAADNLVDGAGCLRDLANAADPGCYRSSVESRVTLCWYAARCVLGEPSAIEEKLTEFQRQAKMAMRSRIQLAWMWMLGIRGATMDAWRMDLENQQDGALRILHSYCNSLPRDFSEYEAALFVTQAPVIRVLRCEGWEPFGESTGRGYVKVGDRTTFLLHYKGARTGASGRRYMIEVPCHNPNSTNYYLRKYYKFEFDPSTEALVHSIWSMQKGYYYDEELCDRDARTIIERYVNKEWI